MTKPRNKESSASALRKLEILVNQTGNELRKFGVEPALVAKSLACFDDTFNYTPWIGLQVGKAYFERREYFEGQHESHGSKSGSHMQKALALLENLEKSEWLALINDAFEFDYPVYSETLAVVVQHDAVWLVISASQGNHDRVYLLTEGQFVEVGEPDRLDGRIGLNDPLLIVDMPLWCFELIKGAVPKFPADRDAIPFAPHSKEMHQLTETIGKVTERARQSGLDRLEFSGKSCDYEEGRNRYYFCRLDKAPANQGTAYDAIREAWDLLEGAHWRRLFNIAVMDVDEDESLSYLYERGKVWVIARDYIVFGFENNVLRVVGYYSYSREYDRDESNKSIKLLNDFACVPD